MFRLADEPTPTKGPIKMYDGELKRRDISVLLDSKKFKPAEIAAQLDVSASLVFQVMRLKKQGKSLLHKKRPGRPLFRTPELLKIVEARFEDDPMASYVQTGKELGVSQYTIARAVKDVGMKDYVCQGKLESKGCFYRTCSY